MPELATLNASEINHGAKEVGRYMVREIISLLKERIGFEFFRLWHQVLLMVVEVSCVDEAIYRRAFELWLNIGASAW